MELERAHWVLHYDAVTIAALSPWHQKEFASVAAGGNGLFEAMLQSELRVGQFERELLALLKRHCPEHACPLSGFSVHCDREVLLTTCRPVYCHLSHQVL